MSFDGGIDLLFHKGVVVVRIVGLQAEPPFYSDPPKTVKGFFLIFFRKVDLDHGLRAMRSVLFPSQSQLCLSAAQLTAATFSWGLRQRCLEFRNSPSGSPWWRNRHRER